MARFLPGSIADIKNRSPQAELDLVVKMYDIDFNGHVNNIVHIRWLEDMRMVGFQKLVSLKSCSENGQVPVLIRTDIRYRRPIKMFDEPKGLLWVTGYSRTTFTIACEICVGGIVHADATQTLAFINLQSGRPVRLPTTMFKGFEEENVRSHGQ